MLRSVLDLTKIKPLDKALWAGAVDNLGGDVLAWIASTMKQDGTIASIGLAASMSLNTTVAPFILRGASLLGIDSGYMRRCPCARRRLASASPATCARAHLAAMTRTIAFDRAAGGVRRLPAGRGHTAASSSRSAAEPIRSMSEPDAIPARAS